MFQPASQVRKYLKVCLWGDAKNGKTRFALSFPQPLAVIDPEKGSVLYADQYAFDRVEVIRWRDLEKPIEWLKSQPVGRYETLVIDSMTPLYQDLVGEVAAIERNRYGKDVISQAAWGAIKRRQKALQTLLLELPMNVVVSMRAKEEYETRPNPKTGEDESQKTGALIADAERSWSYAFDFILECRCDEPKTKTKTPGDPKYTVTVRGSRRHELRKYTVIDVTKQNAFDVIFGPWYAKVAKAGEPLKEETATPAEINDLKGNVKYCDQCLGTTTTPAKRVAELEGFADALAGGRAPGEPATAEDLKVLYTRAGQLAWPDGTPLKSAEAKALIKSLYGIESGKDLHKHEVDFLHDEFGKVLAGRAVLALGENGAPIIATRQTNETAAPAAVAGGSGTR